MIKKNLCLVFAFLLFFAVGYTQTTAKLHGIISDSSVNSIKYIDYQPFRYSTFNVNSFISIPLEENSFNLELKLTSPRLIFLYPPGYSASQTIYITPGDSVSVREQKVGENKFILQFAGRNAGNYNYDVYAQKNSPYISQPFYRKTRNIKSYKNQLVSWRDNKINLFKEYQTKNEVSKDFVEYALADIQNYYITKLYEPISNKEIIPDSIPSGYFDDAKIIENETSHYYRIALAYKNIYCFTANPVEDFGHVYQNIITNTSGKAREFLLSQMIGFYAESQRKDFSDAFLKAIKEAPKYVSDPLCLDYIRKSEEYYTILNQPFPENVLTGTLLKSMESNETISLKTLLSKYEGKLIYLDFWASWCSPCRDDIASSESAKAFLKEKNIQYIYLSRDENEKAWLAGSKKLNIIQDQYQILDNKNTPLAKYLKVNAIPRYVLLDAKQRIGELNAPRPNPENLDQLKQCIMKYVGEKKVVTFF